MASRRASSEGRELLKRRRIEKGWIRTDERWARAVGQILRPERSDQDSYSTISAASMGKFLDGRPIKAENFNALCQALDLDPNVIAEHVLPKLTENNIIPIWDLQDMPKADFFCGRQQELAEIQNWMNMAVPLINIWGAEGIGKTALLAHWVQQQTVFQNTIWRVVNCVDSELTYRDTIEDILNIAVPATERSRDCFLDFNRLLARRKLLIVIDGTFDDKYRKWFQILAKQRYEDTGSCMVVLSELNLDVVLSNKNAAKSRELRGLDLAGVKAFWNYYTSDRSDQQIEDSCFESLRQRYDGNPSILDFFIDAVKRTYGGDLRQAIDETTSLPEWLKDSLKNRFDNLGHIQQQILITIANSDSPLKMSEICARLERHITLDDLDLLRRFGIIRTQNILQEQVYSSPTYWQKYVQRRFSTD